MRTYCGYILYEDSIKTIKGHAISHYASDILDKVLTEDNSYKLRLHEKITLTLCHLRG